MIAIEERELLLVALGIWLVVTLVVGYALLRALRAIQAESLATTTLLRDISGAVSRAANAFQELAQTFLESYMRDLRRMAESARAALEVTIRDLHRAVTAPGAEGEVTPPPSPVSLVIVRRGETKLFELVREKPCTVLWDRRAGERRNRQETVATERRRGERRRPPPQTWDVLGCLVVAGGERGPH